MSLDGESSPARVPPHRPDLAVGDAGEGFVGEHSEAGCQRPGARGRVPEAGREYRHGGGRQAPPGRTVLECGSKNQAVLRHKRPEPSPDARLDPYRRAAARLLDEDEQIGVLVTRVVTWWWREGPSWRRRWGNPRELPEWALSLVGPAQQLPDFDEGIVSAQELDEELADWAAGIFRLRGRRYGLAWLDEEEADAAHREHGWTVD
ncbi:hypothetical protein [Streptomyces sp. CC208A]|uniref:hypothetical protein n=1 Tax=Streptomyces sp. CC208A TaxID=3044573 RepID=UPI0024A80C21|nr:hypothetical protein [Streptomyces sp. CC208A]